ncbi:MAG TPA: sigma-70 family RNA polymerase sigma factor, partial [Thermoanaerobaculia bacterium]|nr:sigma-70 family RNA polymerase sigma factor [Thermoanaerobaculia bacterium]
MATRSVRDRTDPAFGRLVDAEGPRLLAFARRSCGDGSDAEDIVQETFTQAFRAWNQLEDPGAARAWLYAIARRVCQRMRRRRAGEPARLESLDALMPRPSPTVPDLEAAHDPHRALLRAEARELVERGLAELPEAFRLPLVLADIAELTLAEVASVLGLKEATVKTRLHRARLKLRSVLAEGLPQRSAAPPPHGRSVCLDLLRAKLEAIDRRAPLPYSDRALCERCRTLLGTLD